MVGTFFVILRAKLLRKLRRGGLLPLPRGTSLGVSIQPSGILETIKKLPKGPVPEEVISRFVRGDFLVFGRHWISAKEFRWNRDFLSNYEWRTMDNSLKIPIAGTSGADIKIPWEAARFQQWPQVALRAKNEAAQRFAYQVGKFIDENPYYKGIHWLNAMEVSIRAINITLAYEIFRSEGCGFSSEFQNRFSSFLANSYDYILENLEWYRQGRANHYLVDLLGLLFLGRVLGRETEFAANEFREEILRQFLADGGLFESSTYYHRLSLEAAVIGLCFLKPNAEVRERLTRARDFLVALTASDGSMPQIGDNDSGRILKISPEYFGAFENTRNVNDTQAIVDLFLKAEDEIPARDPVFSAFHSSETPQSARNYEFKLPIAELDFKAFPDFGLYIWRSDDTLITVRCGANVSDLLGAHAHFDQLSLTLWNKGEWIVEDPGSFVYNGNPAKRNELRSPRVHHMPQLDDRKFHAVDDRDLFIHEGLPIGHVLLANAKEFRGYYRFDGKDFVRRIEFSEGVIKIQDELYGSGQLLDLNKRRPQAWAYREEARSVLK